MEAPRFVLARLFCRSTTVRGSPTLLDAIRWFSTAVTTCKSSTTPRRPHRRSHTSAQCVPFSLPSRLLPS